MKIQNNIRAILLWVCLFIPMANMWAYTSAKTSVTYNDINRGNRAVTAEIFYPATGTANNSPVLSGSWPIVVFGHGFVMNTTEYDFFYDSLAKAGFIVVMATTEGGFSPNHTDFGNDLSFLVWKLYQEGNTNGSLFYQKVKRRSCVMGHSMGGGASFLASEGDTNITTMINFAAANTNPSAIAIASKINIPALVYSGTKDNVAPASSNQLPLYDSLSSGYKAFISIKDGSHCNFGKASGFSNCVIGETTVCLGCSFVSKAVQHELMFRGSLPWLNYFLNDDCAAFTQFRNFLTTDTRITRKENGSLPLINSVLSGAASEICEGDSTLLTVSPQLKPACSVEWYKNGVKLTKTDTFLMVTDTGNYQVNLINAQNVSKYSNDFQVSYFAKPTVLFSEKTPFARCRQINTKVKVLNTFNSYQWKLNSNLLSNSTDSILIDTNGNYEVTINDSNNCITSTPFQVIAANNVLPQLSLSKSFICPSDSVLLTATNANVKSMHVFRNGLLFDSASSNFSKKIISSGSFKARSIDTNGCIDSSMSVLLTQGIYLKHKIDSLPNGNLSSTIDTNIQWIYNGNELIAGANLKVYKPTKTGYYQVANKVNNDCTVKSDSFYVFIPQQSSINTFKNNVGCYQSGNLLVFESLPVSNAMIHMYDVLGKLVGTHAGHQGKSMNISGFRGVYLIQVSAPGYLEQFKVYIQ